MDHRLFCFGTGFSGRTLFRFLEENGEQGWQCQGTSRSGGKGMKRFSDDHPLDDAARTLAGTTHLLSSVPPGGEGDPVLNTHADDIAGIDDLRWIGYLSTTGGYGDHDGGWVDEDTPLTPNTPRGERRMQAEQAWTELGERIGVPVHIFRLAGIYGPGRNQIVSLRQGKARRIIKPGQMFSRIHVEDIAQTVAKAMVSGLSSQPFNVCDDEACPPQDVVAYAAELAGLPVPPDVSYDEAELSPMARSFYADNKRVRNDRLKERLGVSLRYPTYREGLKACLAAGD